MKNLIITTIYAIICISGIGISIYLAIYAIQFACSDPLPYIAVGVIWFIGLLAAIHNFNRNQ